MEQGNARPLEMQDLWHVEKGDRMAPLSANFQRLYGEEAARATARCVFFIFYFAFGGRELV